MDSPLLRNGVILVDLPGTFERPPSLSLSLCSPGQRDVNLARVKLSENYRLRADHTLIVLDIKRAVDNQSLKTALTELSSQDLDGQLEQGETRQLNATIVCTHADVCHKLSIVYCRLCDRI